LGKLLLIMTESSEAQPRNSCPGEIKNHDKENKRSLPKPPRGGASSFWTLLLQALLGLRAAFQFHFFGK
jgi:hypothetical protein